MSPKAATRKFFTKLREVIPLPDLIELQKKSYEWFFKKGLSELFEAGSDNSRHWTMRRQRLAPV